MNFEWDESKNLANIEKHGLSFNQAKTIFDGFCLYDSDTRFNYGESRYIATGLLNDKVLLVVVAVFTEREDRIRLISARPASKSERMRYYEAIR